eukprot:15350165-Ditylum_brightwellii.AAC.1
MGWDSALFDNICELQIYAHVSTEVELTFHQSFKNVHVAWIKDQLCRQLFLGSLCGDIFAAASNTMHKGMLITAYQEGVGPGFGCCILGLWGVPWWRQVRTTPCT